VGTCFDTGMQFFSIHVLDFKVYLPICGKVPMVGLPGGGVCAGGKVSWFLVFAVELACRCTKDMNSMM
jgi:hypothetical protein